MSLVPDDDIWCASNCAAHFNVSHSVFMRRVRFEEGFPPQLDWSIGAHPRWLSEAVKDWTPPARQSRKTTLYRHFSEFGELLYIGISLSHVARLATHRQKASWFRRVSRIELEHFDTPQAAKAAERAAIQSEHPLFNRAHSKRT